MTSYEMAKDKYAAWGGDTEKAMEQLKAALDNHTKWA